MANVEHTHKPKIRGANMTWELLEQIVRATLSYAFSTLSYTFIWKSKSVKKNMAVGAYFYVLSVVIGYICRQLFKWLPIWMEHIK
jgi:hypothetical protein